MTLTTEAKAEVNQLVCELSITLTQQARRGTVEPTHIESLARLIEAFTGPEVPERVPVVGFIAPPTESEDDAL